MATFADLGMHFPLFEAAVEDACIDEAGQCCACRKRAEIRFERACYACFRAGKSDRTADTQFGMVRPEDAARGITHGAPIDPSAFPGYHVVPLEETDEEVRLCAVRIASDELIELLRTPDFHSWQGSTWLFCCQRPAVFIGELPIASLARDPRGLVAGVAQALAVSNAEAEETLEGIDAGRLASYAFRCRTCERLVGYVDGD